MGLGNFGGSNTMLFGGSGGQNIFQKITWALGFIFMAGSLVLSIMKTSMVKSSRYIGKYPMMQQRQVGPQPAAPTAAPAETQEQQS